jgi:hypothetical protein
MVSRLFKGAGKYLQIRAYRSAQPFGGLFFQEILLFDR